jgi:hypothetical protein
MAPLERSLEQTLERSIEQTLERSIEQTLERSIEQTLERSIERTLERTYILPCQHAVLGRLRILLHGIARSACSMITNGGIALEWQVYKLCN